MAHNYVARASKSQEGIQFPRKRNSSKGRVSREASVNPKSARRGRFAKSGSEHSNAKSFSRGYAATHDTYRIV